jgi:hypothetical protein
MRRATTPRLSISWPSEGIDTLPRSAMGSATKRRSHDASDRGTARTDRIAAGPTRTQASSLPQSASLVRPGRRSLPTRIRTPGRRPRPRPDRPRARRWPCRSARSRSDPSKGSASATATHPPAHLVCRSAPTRRRRRRRGTDRHHRLGIHRPSQRELRDLTPRPIPKRLPRRTTIPRLTTATHPGKRAPHLPE